MKIAKLPNGKVIQFEDHVPDEEIDAHVREHMKDHINKTLDRDTKSKLDEERIERHHQELIHGLSTVAQLLHNIAEGGKSNHQELVSHMTGGHLTIGKAISDLAKAHKTPKKTKAIRDKDGRIIGAEVV